MDTAASYEQTARWIRELAAIERPSASPGERDAAEWLVRQFGAAGLGARIETERAHGTHLPFVLPSVAALAAGVVRSRWLAVTVALVALAAIADELEGRRRVLRRALARRETYNVVCEMGAARPERTIVFVAHHDVARPWGALFGRLASAPPHAALGGRPLPGVAALAYAPLTVAAGILTRRRAIRRAGMAACGLICGFFADIARRPPVPGAVDNAAGVAALLGMAADIAAASSWPSTRVVLLSTGSEETMLEGMHAFLERHRDKLDPDRTLVVCLDQIGWDDLVLRRSEGVLRQRRSDPADLDAMLAAADRSGVPLRVLPQFPTPSDGLAARWAGLRTVFLSSVASDGGYPNYHRPSDVPENVNVGSVLAARRLCVALVDELRRQGPEAAAESQRRRQEVRPPGEENGDHQIGEKG
ncbi:MAG: M28 family peptidase [Gaiellaceae bacterium]